MTTFSDYVWKYVWWNAGIKNGGTETTRLLQQFEWQTMGTSVKAVAAELRNEENGVDVRRDVKEVESAE